MPAGSIPPAFSYQRYLTRKTNSGEPPRIMSAIEVSSYFGLAAIPLLTLNILIGLVMSVKHKPVRDWPHLRINTFKIHNWTAYIALSVAIIHPVIILFSSNAKFTVVDILYPVDAPRQPWINVL